MTEQDEPTGEVSLVGGRSTVTRLGQVVFRQAAPWSKTTVALLRHLEREGFEHAPRIIGEGFDGQGREMLTYVEGESPHPYPWDDDALPVLGTMLRKLHLATSSFTPPLDAVWRPWFGRTLGQASVIGHCDTGAWNIIARDRVPVALIDWEEAGPVDPMTELAQACWLNALQLDGYDLPNAARIGFVGRIRDFAVLNAANEIIQETISPTTDAAGVLEAVTWRARSAAWLVKHHGSLERMLTAVS